MPPPRIALAQAALEQKDIATAERAVAALVAAARALGPVNRAFALSLAGDMLDAQDRTAEAFAAYAAVQGDPARCLCAHPWRAWKAWPRARRAWPIISAADPHWPGAQRRRTGPHTHVFLVGFPRSGTTLLEQVLASHPDVDGDGRAHLPARIRRSRFFGSRCRSRSAGGAVRCRAGIVARRPIGSGWRKPGVAPTKPVFLDKMPLNSVFLPLDRQAVSRRENPCWRCAIRAMWCCPASAAALP